MYCKSVSNDEECRVVGTVPYLTDRLHSQLGGSSREIFAELGPSMTWVEWGDGGLGLRGLPSSPTMIDKGPRYFVLSVVGCSWVQGLGI